MRHRPILSTSRSGFDPRCQPPAQDFTPLVNLPLPVLAQNYSSIATPNLKPDSGLRRRRRRPRCIINDSSMSHGGAGPLPEVAARPSQHTRRTRRPFARRC